MHNRLIALLVGCVAFSAAQAQSIQPQVIASAGQHFSNANAQLSFTAGEVVIETVTSANSIITQGFHQPDAGSSAIEENLPPFIEVSIFPNPSADEITLALKGNSMDMQLAIFSMEGKALVNQTIPAYQGSTLIDVRDFANAGYLLHIRSANNEHFATYKIQKTR